MFTLKKYWEKYIKTFTGLLVLWNNSFVDVPTDFDITIQNIDNTNDKNNYVL